MKTSFDKKSPIKLHKMNRTILKDNFEFTLQALPALLFFFVFCYIPMFGIVLAFKNYRYDLGVFGSPWVGFKNFEYFFSSGDLGRVVTNTVFYGALFIVVNIITGVIIALLLYEITNRAALKTYQTIMILPNFMSWVIVAFITYIFLNHEYGVFNRVITFLGGEGIEWYAESKYWPYILTIVNTWKGIGLGSIMYYAALMGLDREMYEAATIDGAGRFKQALYISIPSLSPIICIMMIMSVGNIFRGDFGLFYQIPRDIGALYPTTDVIDTYIYRGLRNGNFSVMTAVGLIQSVVGLVTVLVTNWIVTKIEPNNAMF